MECAFTLKKKKKAAFILHPCLFTTKLPVLHTDFDTEITSWIKMASTQTQHYSVYVSLYKLTL